MSAGKISIRPPLKWAGGKTQLLDELLERMPAKYGKYIEPFFGGGALFFAVEPSISVISDSNPELINFYRVLASNVEGLIDQLTKYENTEECFYKARNLDWRELEPTHAAARMLFLNRTCFNGLYRVNKEGMFNVPYGKYKSPLRFDTDNLRKAAQLLSHANIVVGDYREVLDEHASSGDFIFLDPPYIPISRNSDFKRYTKKQFNDTDHALLAETVRELECRGCYVVLTNSNHPLVREQYDEYVIDVVPTKRNISCRSNTRTSEDIIVTVPNEGVFSIRLVEPLPEQVSKYPPPRFMGSKIKLLPEIMATTSRLKFDSVIDLFSGSGIVSYLFKACGKQVFSNDYMRMSHVFTKALVENNTTTLSADELNNLLRGPPNDLFVSETFRDLYFEDEDNLIIDIIRTNIKEMDDEYKRSIALAALIRACMKKRPRGIFTYVGNRYDDGRRDLALSLAEHFRA